MDVNSTIVYLVIGTVIGVLGQGIRVVVGIKKKLDIASATGESKKQWFDWGRLLISLGIGGIAGFLGALTLWELNVDRTFLFTMLGAGYSGTDFIEGLMKTEPVPPKPKPDQATGQPASNP
jgi:hypothetical protein